MFVLPHRVVHRIIIICRRVSKSNQIESNRSFKKRHESIQVIMTRNYLYAYRDSEFEFINYDFFKRFRQNCLYVTP